MARLKIIDVIWKEGVDSAIGNPSVIGIVAFQSNPASWTTSMGITRLGWSIKNLTKKESREAAENIIEVGTPLTKEQAQVFFPKLDIIQYNMTVTLGESTVRKLPRYKRNLQHI
jgi:hypothetical protein